VCVGRYTLNTFFSVYWFEPNGDRETEQLCLLSRVDQVRQHADAVDMRTVPLGARMVDLSVPVLLSTSLSYLQHGGPSNGPSKELFRGRCGRGDGAHNYLHVGEVPSSVSDFALLLMAVRLRKACWMTLWMVLLFRSHTQ